MVPAFFVPETTAELPDCRNCKISISGKIYLVGRYNAAGESTGKDAKYCGPCYESLKGRADTVSLGGE